MTEPLHAATGHQRLIVYDGACGICTRLVRHAKRSDTRKQFIFMASSDPTVKSLAPQFSPNRAKAELLLYDPVAGWSGGYDAVVLILRGIPIYWILVPLTWLPGSRFCGSKIYALVARNRGKISQWLGLDACKVDA